MIPFGLTSLMTVSLPIARRATKCLVPGASAIYLFNEGSGTTLTDYSGNGNHGTFGAGAAAPTWGVPGLSFDGGDYATAPTDPALDTLTGLTVQAVVAPTDTTTGRLVARSTTVNTTGGAGWILSKSTAPVFIFYDADGVRHAATGPTLTTGAVAVFTGIWDGAEIVAYNGTVAGEAVACTSHVAATEQTLTFGKDSFTNASYLVATLHGCVIYPAALTPAQIAQTTAFWRAKLAASGLVLP